jgi:lipopolysaccharide transport system permease protein
MTQLTATDMPVLEIASAPPRTQESSDVLDSFGSCQTIVTVIEPRSRWSVDDLQEYWRYRELLVFLTWRDIAVRYKQSFLGVTWAILQPLSTMLVFTLIFGRFVEVPAGELAYPIFVLAGLLPWFFFSNGMTSASQSVVGNQNLITKVYFPRLLIPMGAVVAGLVDFVVAMGLLAVMMLVYGVWPGSNVLLLPVMLMGLVAATMGMGILLSALTVKYRDFRHIVPFMVQLWMFMTPSIYMRGTDSIDPQILAVLPINPAYGLILNFRAAVLGSPFDFYSLTISVSMSVLLLLLGCWYFRRVERSFADVI